MNGLVVFPTFFNLSEFGNKGSMIWAKLTFQFCFCCLYRASQSLEANNIINLISVLTIWGCPCVASSLLLLEEGVCYDQCILLAKLLAFALLHFVLQAKLTCYSRYLLTSFFCIPVPYNEKYIFWGMLVLEGLVHLHRTIQLQLLQHYWLGHRLGLPCYWTEIASKYCISDSFVDYDGYSISSKGFLPTVVDIMVSWVKFTHCSPF